MPSQDDHDTTDHAGAESRRPRLLISSGPTWEPIDAVRYIGNRSSGKLGAAVSDAAAAAGWQVTHLAGPGSLRPTSHSVRVVAFESCADLEACLSDEMPSADILVMAAAVADYRPIPAEVNLDGKRRRRGDMSLKLESTPDLLRGCSEHARCDQLLVGFALEPQAELVESALNKLERKGIDAIVANPLETMSADTVSAMLITNDGRRDTAPAHMTKAAFAAWLVERLGPEWARKTSLMENSRA